MASVKGVNFTNITADPIVNADSSEWSGKLRVQYDTYGSIKLSKWFQTFQLQDYQKVQKFMM